MSYQYRDLPNGIRVIHSPSFSRVSHLGIYLNTGSRDEKIHEQGIAHFIEHMAFKGTTHRKAYHILNRLDNVGGDMNAFTTKEYTCLYASFLKGYESRAAELFADVILNSVFPAKEIEKEKGIIFDEINTYKDSPSESIFDDFEEMIYTGHPLGRNILGTPESVKVITRKQIISFIRRNYSACEMVIAYTGSVSPDRLKSVLFRHFSSIPEKAPARNRLPFSEYKATHKVSDTVNFQTNAITGTIAYPIGHPGATSLHLLNNIIGGPGSNSRLNLSLRERKGLTYHVESNYQPFSDSGYFSIYLGTASEHGDAAIECVFKELNYLTIKPLGILQLHRAKKQLSGQLALAFESKPGEMLSIGKRLLYQNKVESPDEIIAKIESITASDLLDTARDILRPENFSTLIYKAGNNDKA